jgi:hypothetical protein
MFNHQEKSSALLQMQKFDSILSKDETKLLDQWHNFYNTGLNVFSKDDSKEKIKDEK